MSQDMVIDKAVLSELKNIMGDEYVSVYESFVRSCDKHLSDLDAAIKGGDVKNVEVISHTLKGSSANIGAKKLSEMCKLLLEQSRLSNTSEFEVMAININEEYDRVKKVIIGMIK